MEKRKTKKEIVKMLLKNNELEERDEKRFQKINNRKLFQVKKKWLFYCTVYNTIIDSKLKNLSNFY